LDLLSHLNGLLPFRELDNFDTLPVHQATRELMVPHFCETVSGRIEPRSPQKSCKSAKFPVLKSIQSSPYTIKTHGGMSKGPPRQ